MDNSKELNKGSLKAKLRRCMYCDKPISIQEDLRKKFCSTFCKNRYHYLKRKNSTDKMADFNLNIAGKKEDDDE